MSAPIVNQARAVLDAVQEGQVTGSIMTINTFFPHLSALEVSQYVRRVHPYLDLDDLNYWLAWSDLPELED